MCKPVYMPKDEFQKIKHLPDPMLGEKDLFVMLSRRKPLNPHLLKPTRGQSHYHSQQVYNTSRI